MSIKDKYSVKPIKHYETKEWLLYKHYAKRMPSISYAFGLYEDRNLIGVCTFGMPQSNDLRESICGIEKRDFVYELNRLVIDDNLDKNTLSFFVSQALKLLPSPLIIVSYADQNKGHHGYIYQATNFLFTGYGGDTREFIVNNKQISTRSYKDTLKSNGLWNYDLTYAENVIKNGGEVIKLMPKYRYVYFIGSKAEKKEFNKLLRFSVKPYPKGDNARYDTSYKPETQITLF